MLVCAEDSMLLLNCIYEIEIRSRRLLVAVGRYYFLVGQCDFMVDTSTDGYFIYPNTI